MILPKIILRKISQIENIATLPDVAFRILEIVKDNSTSMEEISKIIEKDSSITTRILKISNSPVWGYPGKIDSIKRALVLLGLKQVANIVVAVSLYTAFTRLKPSEYFNRDKFWLHSAATGQIARLLTKKIGFNYQGEEFVSALIHDLGKLVLDQFFNKEFEGILKEAQESGKQIFTVEEEVLGCNHAHVSAWILNRWHFPDSIVTAVQYHHNPQNAPRHQDLTAIVCLADILCETWEVGFDQDLPERAFQQENAWNILINNNTELFDLDFEKFSTELKEEIEGAQLFVQLINS